jgi:hypothetical protein
MSVVQPDVSRIGATGLMKEIPARDDLRFETELPESYEGQSFVLEVADWSGRHYMQEEMSVVSLHDDGTQIYPLGRDSCCRDVTDRADLRIERRLNERVMKSGMSDWDRGSRLK